MRHVVAPGRRPRRHAHAGMALVAGVVADQLLGDPRRGHPVAGFGRVAQTVEGRLWADERRAGVAFLAATVGPAVVAAVLAERVAERRVGAPTALLAATTWAAVGGRQLRAVAGDVHQRLAAGDLEVARARLPSLVGRDPTSLDAAGMARAVVESLAENTADAVVGSLVWGAVLGAPGVVAHRTVNTLDAMVGHRSPRYGRFGTAAAVADDVLGHLPSRLTAALTVALAPVVGGSPAAAWRAWRRDASRHASPNAGPVEAAAAGALGRTLGGEVTYGGRREVRCPLGDGPPPGVDDIPRAVRLSAAITVAATGMCALLAHALRR